MSQLCTATDVRDWLAGDPHSDAAGECIAGLDRCPNTWRLSGTNDLRVLAQRCHTPDGIFIVTVLRAFMPHADMDPELGLAIVYQLMAETAGSGFEPIDETVSVAELGELFAMDPANWFRVRALAVVADSLVALGGWIEAWNRRMARRLMTENYNETEESKTNIT